MKNIISFLLITALCAAFFAACGGKAASSGMAESKSEDNPKAKAEFIIDESFIAESTTNFIRTKERASEYCEAVYTNKNGLDSVVVVPNVQLSDVKIMNNSVDGENYIYNCTASFSNADWIGTTSFTAVYTHPAPEAYFIEDVTFADAIAEPSYPLDFSDENIYRLFEVDAFRYKPSPTEKMTSTPVNKDTLQSVKMLEFISHSPNERDSENEYYHVELRFSDGLVLQGTMFTYYFPALSEKEGTYEGIHKWAYRLNKDDFLQVK